MFIVHPHTNDCKVRIISSIIDKILPRLELIQTRLTQWNLLINVQFHGHKFQYDEYFTKNKL